MNKSFPSTPLLGFRRSAQVVLVDSERFSMQSSWRDHLELRRDRRAQFSVHARKLIDGKWNTWNSCKGLITPLQVMNAIDESADLLGVVVEYVEALPLIKCIDWVTAAVIAEKIGHDLPTPNEFAILTKQRSYRSFGKVTIGVEWGYDMHTISMPFERWLRVLGGELYIQSERYNYEGNVSKAQWRFNGRQLEVTYDDGGTGWEGGLDILGLLVGPQVDEVDIAKLAIQALSVESKK